MSESRRAAIYARVSTDKQSLLSPESQIRKCREAAEARGFCILDEHVYRDDGISGVSTDRPAFQRMMAAALSHSKPFSAIFCDDTSRLSRSTEDSLGIFAKLNFAGVQLVAVSQAIDSSDEQADVLLTVHGLVDSLYVKELRKKIHRGLDERVLRGLHAGGRCFGYVTADAEGGKSVIVNEAEAEIVREIFRMSSEGASLKTIAKSLNSRCVPVPRPRRDRVARGWCPTAIREMLRNERYIGRVVWNRCRFVKAPGTNRRVARPRPQSEWRVTERPEQRIVSDELWNAVRSRLRWLTTNFANSSRVGLLVRNASSRSLFSGFLYCAECGGRLTLICGHGKKSRRRYGCARNFHRGTCSNSLREREDRIEGRLLAGLQQTVLQPKIAEYAIRRFGEELKKKVDTSSGHFEALRIRREQLKLELRNLTATAALAGPSPHLVEEIAVRERELAKISDELLGGESGSIQQTLEELREFVISRLAKVGEVLNAAGEKARAEIGRHAPHIVMTPVAPACDGRGHYVATGNWNLLGGDGRNGLEMGRAPYLVSGGARMVAGVRFELTTFGL